jgi:hypothetical protein
MLRSYSILALGWGAHITVFSGLFLGSPNGSGKYLFSAPLSLLKVLTYIVYRKYCNLSDTLTKIQGYSLQNLVSEPVFGS